ncbi:hypothetical protein ACGFK1_05275 [Mycobacterium sp. NPDC048908]|uniref:hypothetical protein n=1 Tax=Mycobacterium sp. NPDC048908 TaxID=3364292 RepID=UPI00371C41B5
MNRLSRLATALVMSCGVSLSGLGMTTAQADGPSYQGGNCPGSTTCTHWCPGDPLIPGSQVISWDWNICHDWFWNSEGVVDVNANVIYPWRGVPHPAGLRPPYSFPPP